MAIVGPDGVVVSTSSGDKKKVKAKVEETLIQDYGRWFKVIPSNYRFIQEDLFGDRLTIKTPGLTWLDPLRKGKLVCISSFHMDINFEDSLNNIDNIELSLKPVEVFYHLSDGIIRDPRTGKKIPALKKFYRERANALKLIEKDIKTLVVYIVSKSHYDILKGLELTKGEVPLEYKNSYNDDEYNYSFGVENKVNSLIDNIKSKYGIIIEKIKISDVNYPDIITNAKAEAMQQTIVNEKLKEKAAADKEIAKLNADAQRYIESVRYDVLFQYAEEHNLSKDDIVKILRLQALKGTNATVIEGCGGLDSLVGILLNQYLQRYGNSGNSHNAFLTDNGFDDSYDDGYSHGRRF